MGAPSPAGWYPDPSGALGQRYFDGQDWTEHFAPPARLPSEERTERLDAAIAAEVAQYQLVRVENRAAFQATLIYGRNPNHVVHAILSVFTCGLWLLVWLIAAASSREGRALLQVDAYGNVTRTP